jgi:hypothetical protein
MKFWEYLMKKVWLDSRREYLGLCLRVVSVLVAAALLTSCRALPPLPAQVQDLGPAYQPSNIYRRANSLPPEVHRVALLPLTTTSPSAYLIAGAETLEPLIYAELEKAKRFEVIPVTSQQMKQWTGQESWRADEQLPPNLFERISAGTACDAVFFCQLTRYQPYQPLAVGWKFSLVENPKGTNAETGEIQPRILWSVDEVLDAGDPAVTTGARLYYTQHLRNDAPSADPATMLISPARFGQYTLSTLLGTLPESGLQKH